MSLKKSRKVRKSMPKKSISRKVVKSRKVRKSIPKKSSNRKVVKSRKVRKSIPKKSNNRKVVKSKKVRKSIPKKSNNRKVVKSRKSTPKKSNNRKVVKSRKVRKSRRVVKSRKQKISRLIKSRKIKNSRKYRVGDDEYNYMKRRLENGADKETINLMLSETMDPKITQLLIDFGGDVNYKSRYTNQYILHNISIYSNFGYPANTEILLKNGANPNIKDENGRTPLFITKNPLFIKSLLENGADPYIQDNQGNYSFEGKSEKVLQTYIDLVPDFENFYIKWLCDNHGKSEYRYIEDHPYFHIPSLKEKIDKKCPEFIHNIQRFQPNPLTPEIELYSSKRAKASFDYFFKEAGHTPKKIKKSSINYFDNLDNSSTCFCLNMKLGKYLDYYIPVSTYRGSISTGFYGSIRVDPLQSRYLYYYWEPESKYLLYSPKTLLARNKIHAYYILLSEKNNTSTIDTILEEFREEIKLLFGISMEEWLELQSKEEKILGDRSDYTSWLRKLSEDSKELKTIGLTDDLDRLIGNLAIELSYDCIIMTHQTGSYGRLVTEVLDVRTRVDSIKSIYISK